MPRSLALHLSFLGANLNCESAFNRKCFFFLTQAFPETSDPAALAPYFPANAVGKTPESVLASMASSYTLDRINYSSSATAHSIPVFRGFVHKRRSYSFTRKETALSYRDREGASRYRIFCKAYPHR